MTDMAGTLAHNELKRKAAPGLAHRSKKTCIDPDLVAPSLSSEDEDSDFDNDNEDDDEASQNGSGTTTPLTTHSTKQNPQWPSRQKIIPCTFPDCKKMFNRQAKLQDHLRSHKNERQHVCPEPGCGKDFLRKTHLERHIKSAHTNERDFLCSFEGCGKGFSTGTRLRRHEAQHVERQQYTCSDCGKEFRKQATLQRHIDAEHKGELPYACEYQLKDGSICDARFSKSAGLQNHHRRLHDEKSYWCDLCMARPDQDGSDWTANDQQTAGKDYGFATYSEYQVHMRDVHPPVCDVCSMVCQSKKLLLRHKELEHGIIPASAADKPTLTCPDPGCSKTFSKKGNMDVHFRSVHANQRPFVCGQVELSTLNHVEGWNGHDACGKDFKAKIQLEDHIRTTHLGLLNRAQTRKAAKAKELRDNASLSGAAIQPQNKVVVSYLTGTAYSENLRRDVECPITGCQFKFTKQYDCDIHVQLVHGIDGENLEFQAICSYNDNTALQPAFDPTSDTVAGDEQDDHDNDFVRGLELNARHGGAFWIGGNSPEHRPRLTRDDDYDHFEDTQDEMDRLVGSVNGWEDDIIMDPALRDV